MTSLKANEILKNKFWIIEDTDKKEKVGTLSKDQDNRFMYSCDAGSYFYDNKNAVEKQLGNILWTKGDITDKASPSKEIYNLPTSTTPKLVRRCDPFTSSMRLDIPLPLILTGILLAPFTRNGKMNT